jgi:hypothetical protein
VEPVALADPGPALAGPGLADSVLSDPALALADTVPDEPVLDEPVPDEPVPDEPVPDEPVPDEPVPDEPTPDEWAPAELEAPPTGLGVEPFGGAELDADELGAEELGVAELGAEERGAEERGVDGLALRDAGAEADAARLDSAVLPGAGVALRQVAAPAAPAVPFLLFAALRLAVPAVVAVLVTVAVAVLVTVTVEVAVAVLVAMAAAVLGLPGVLDTEPAGVTLGVAALLDLAVGEGNDVEVAVHGVAVRSPWPLALTPGLIPPADETTGVPPPATPCVPLALCEDSPVTLPIWYRASRVGGSARATATANTAHATARAGRSSPSHHSPGRCCSPGRCRSPVRRAVPIPACRRPVPACRRSALPVPACRRSAYPPRQADQRRVRPASKPPAAGAQACLLVRAGPDLTRARIRSRPSERGSTWSAAACSAWRRNSPKSGPCGGGVPLPGITAAPGRCAGRSCHGRCGS